MPIIKRRLDICGRERCWEYVVEAAGDRYEVRAQQIGQGEPEFHCTCGSSVSGGRDLSSLFDSFQSPCSHIAEAQRDLNIARQAAAQMIP